MKIKHDTERWRLHRYMDTPADAVDRGVHGAPHPGSTGLPRGAHLFRSLSALGQRQRVEVGVLLIASLQCGHEATNVRIEVLAQVLSDARRLVVDKTGLTGG